jgi:hypothetical protein
MLRNFHGALAYAKRELIFEKAGFSQIKVLNKHLKKNGVTLPLKNYEILQAMRNSHLLIFLASILLSVTSCNDNKENSDGGAIFGQWELKTPDATVELFVFQDSTFHVDVLMNQGVEVEGEIVLEINRATFINVQGTDSISSDPTPGIYNYQITGDSIRFEKIDDPLSRRANFLSQTWARIQ